MEAGRSWWQSWLLSHRAWTERKPCHDNAALLRRHQAQATGSRLSHSKAVVVQAFFHGMVRGSLALALGHICTWTLSSSSAGGLFTAPAACPCVALRLLHFPVKSHHPLPALAWVAGAVWDARVEMGQQVFSAGEVRNKRLNPTGCTVLQREHFGEEEESTLNLRVSDFLPCFLRN